MIKIKNLSEFYLLSVSAAPGLGMPVKCPKVPEPDLTEPDFPTPDLPEEDLPKPDVPDLDKCMEPTDDLIKPMKKDKKDKCGE